MGVTTPSTCQPPPAPVQCDLCQVTNAPKAKPSDACLNGNDVACTDSCQRCMARVNARVKYTHDCFASWDSLCVQIAGSGACNPACGAPN
jgi:hypothetical protein